MGIGGSIALITNQAEDPVVSNWVRNTVLAGGSVSLNSRYAHNTYVKGCKSDNIWGKLSTGVIMPFASDLYTGCIVPLIAPGGSSFSPTLMSATDYSFAGGIDFGAANVDPKRIVTNINAQSIFVLENAQVSVYRPIYRIGRDSVANTLNGADLQNRLQFHCNWEDGHTTIDLFDYSSSLGRLDLTGINPVGFMTGSRLSGTVRLYKNATEIGNINVSGSSVPNATINLLGVFDPVITFYSRSTTTFLYLGQALTASEELIHYGRVQELQKSLGRQV
jgi:hypothetical protein